MDQLERVRSLLAKITYKPGWVITAFEHGVMREPKNEYSFYDPTRIYIRILCLQPDTVTGRETEISHHSSLSRYDVANMKDADVVGYLISNAIRHMELHEMDEWLRFDGVHVRDPHPKI